MQYARQTAMGKMARPFINKNFYRTFLALFAGVVLAMTLTTTGSAQTDTGRVTGSVTDATGAVIPGATITLTNAETGSVQTITSGGDGYFNFSAVPRGSYKVEAKMQGFATTTQNFTLQVSQVQDVVFHLNPGAASTVVEVTDAAPAVDLSTSSIGEVVEGRQVTELPLNGRNFTSLALLTPGVTRGNYGNSASGVNGDAETFRNSSSGGGALSNNGLRPQANNYILDGVDNNEALVNTLDFFPNIEGTQEFRVNTSVASAEFGRAGGAIVQTSIKSGTNQIHGSAFEFARSSLFDASPNYRFQGAGVAPVLPFKRNQFGGSLGGPIIRNRLFIFGDYQGLRESPAAEPGAAHGADGADADGQLLRALQPGDGAGPGVLHPGCGCSYRCSGGNDERLYLRPADLRTVLRQHHSEGAAEPGGCQLSECVSAAQRSGNLERDGEQLPDDSQQRHPLQHVRHAAGLQDRRTGPVLCAVRV